MDAIVFLPLTQGQVAVIDFEDFEKVRGIKWFAHKRRGVFYAARNVPSLDGGRETQSLHQLLLPGAAYVDHQDGDGLNNRRGNLRAASNQQNCSAFRRKGANATSKFRGVDWDPKRLKWRAQIKVNYKTIYLGLFKGEEDAARAYDSAAHKYFGEFASPNFPS